MKKNIDLISATCLFASLTACSSDMPIAENMSSQTVSSDDSKRTVNDILAIASDYWEIKTGGSRAGQMLVNRNAVVPIVANLTRSGADTLIYAVNYPDDNGYLIVSGEKSTEPILAMIDNGSFDESRLSQNDGLGYFVDCANDYVQSSKYRKRDSLPTIKPFDPATDLVWEKYCDTIKSIRVSEPRVEVNWNQYWPENQYCPNKIAGCGPVAIAQILSYFKPNINLTLTFDEKPCNTLAFEWDGIVKHTQSGFWKCPTQAMIDSHMAGCSKDYGWHNQLGVLVRQIGADCNSMYNEDATSTYNSKIWSVCNRLLSNQSRTHVSGTGFYNELEKGGVALICGQADEGGHAWVLDGTGMIQYDCTTYYNYDPKTGLYGSKEFNRYFSLYVHCNWGWGGQDNGYFLENVYDTDKGVENLTRVNFNSKIEGYVYK